MDIPYVRGRVAQQAHVALPEGTVEEEYARNGFFGRYAHLYRTNAPVAWSRIEGPLRPRLYDLGAVEPGDYLAARVPVLASAREVLAAEAELHAAVHELRAGWEPTLRVVFDGIVPIEPLLRAVGQLARERVPTQIDVRAEFLAGVEDTFVRSAADLMIAVVPPAVALTAVPLPALPASLVAHRDHPLAHGRHDTKALRRHLLLTVRGSDPRLELPTAAIEAHATVHLNDFGAKRAAVLAGIGYGWLPDALIADDLARGRVRRIAWTRASRHRFVPRLYHRGHPGPAARRLIAAIA